MNNDVDGGDGRGVSDDVSAGLVATGFKRNHLRYFVTVAEQGQISRAARKLHLAQPALSQSIAQLEAQIGVDLFVRHARGVTLTPAGDRFLTKARVAVEAAVDLERTAQALARSSRGTIVFGHTALPPWLADPQLIESFTETYPDVEIDLRHLTFPIAPASEWLAEVDVAIIPVLSPDPKVWAVPISSYPRALLVAKTHPLAPRSELSVAEVLDETFIAFDPSVDPVWAGFWSLDDCRGGTGPKLTDERSLDAQARFRMIASGAGVSTSPHAHPVINGANIPGVTAILIRDAPPVVFSLVGHADRANPAVDGLVASARRRGRDLEA